MLCIYIFTYIHVSCKHTHSCADIHSQANVQKTKSSCPCVPTCESWPFVFMHACMNLCMYGKAVPCWPKGYLSFQDYNFLCLQNPAWNHASLSSMCAYQGSMTRRIRCASKDKHKKKQQFANRKYTSSLQNYIMCSHHVLYEYSLPSTCMLAFCPRL